MENKQIYALVKAGFTSQHTSLHKYCNAHGIAHQNAYKALLGMWKGRRGLEIRQLLIDASGAQVHNLEAKVVNQSCEPDAMVHNL